MDRTAAIAHSFGTDAAVDLAEAGRVSSLVLIDSAPDYRCATYPPGLSLITRKSLVALAQRIAPAFTIQLAMRRAFAPGFRYSDVPGSADLVVRDFRNLAPIGPRVALVERRRELAANPLDARIARIDIPVLAIHGRRDRLYDCAQTIARYSAAGARTAIIEDAGHSPNIERPAEVVAVVREFLTLVIDAT
ncbi:alpha/beta hydrolase [Nocardia sp. NPDC127606]|uniref:alpha/beta hydrolase n=1 Tax=Nocardia sp. NPDC127606 TaxID=3345406 RepID=UPI00362DA72B